MYSSQEMKENRVFASLSENVDALKEAVADRRSAAFGMFGHWTSSTIIALSILLN
jgi:hypothetical protein